ncbi:hypothetical protein ACI65C_004422 [Semiaphis heraclei]
MTRHSYKCCIAGCSCKDVISNRFPNPRLYMGRLLKWMEIVGLNNMTPENVSSLVVQSASSNHTFNNGQSNDFDMSSVEKLSNSDQQPGSVVPSTSYNMSNIVVQSPCSNHTFNNDQSIDFDMSGIKPFSASLLKLHDENQKGVKDRKEKKPVVKRLQKHGALSKINVGRISQLTPRCKQFYSDSVILNKQLNRLKTRCISFKSHLAAASKLDDDTFLKVLGENVKRLKNKDKFCVILFDEVSLEAQLHYDHNVGSIMGFEDNSLERTQNFADHSLVFMIKGITKKYKQPMSYTFCQSSTNKHDLANQIRMVIQAVTSVGLKVVASICDQGTSNSAAIRVLNNYTKEYYLRRKENNHDDNFYEIKCGDERLNVIHLYDPPHLIKGIKNNLLKKNLVCTINGERKEARWQDIIDLYELENNIQEVRMLPRLTREHVIPN